MATLLCLALAIFTAACAPASMPLSAIPVTAQSAAFAVHEYPLVEQSEDNPTHVEFQQRVPAAVAAQRDGWGFPRPAGTLRSANQALAPFGFEMQANTAPPFSGYVLARDGEVMKRDIASFWPVLVQTNAVENSSDFVLPFVTLDGEKLIAKTTGIYPWSGQAGEMTGPLFYSEPMAYTVTDGGGLNVSAGHGLRHAAPRQTAETRSCWPLEIGGRVIQDAQELNQAYGYDESFGFSKLQDQPLYLYTSDGLTRISYAGKDLPYIYDQVLHDQNGELNIFNPGSNGSVTWFYALRDGLWYYVEAGLFE